MSFQKYCKSREYIDKSGSHKNICLLRNILMIFRKGQDDLIKACLELAMGGVTCDMYRYKGEEWSVVGVQ